ncbi:MAG: NAD-binding protein [Alphaproteobacteria bacterium]
MIEPNTQTAAPPQKSFDTCLIGAGQNCFDAALSKLRAGQHVAIIVPHDANEILSEAQQRDFSFLDKETHILHALYAAGENARALKRTKTLGLSINAPEPNIDWRGVKLAIQNTLERIAPYYAAERLRGLGAEIFFVADDESDFDHIITADDQIDLRAKSNQAQRTALHIEGLSAQYFEGIGDILNWPKLPAHLTIIGIGGAALSIAQALGSLGCNTAVIAPDKILPAGDTELFKILYDSFEKNDKIRLIEGADIAHGEIDKDTGKRIIHMLHLGAKRRISSERVLLITEENTQENAQKGVQGDRQESTAATLTQPAIAEIGLNECAARERFGLGNFHLVKWRMQDSSFALSQARSDGLLKLVAQTDGTLLGAGYCGENAAEVIALLSLALEQNLKIQDLRTAPHTHNAQKTAVGYASLIHEAAQGYFDQVISKLEA